MTEYIAVANDDPVGNLPIALTQTKREAGVLVARLQALIKVNPSLEFGTPAVVPNRELVSEASFAKAEAVSSRQRLAPNPLSEI